MRLQEEDGDGPSFIYGFLIIRRKMKPRKGHFKVVPHVGNKLFSSFGGKILGKKFYVWKKKYCF